MASCSISQSTYFAVSYSGRLDRMLDNIKLGEASATYIRRVAIIYTSIAWIMVFMIFAFTLYSMFFTGGHMDILLAPFTIHVNSDNLPDLLLARIVMLLFTVYTEAAWIFPHAMSFMIATIFTHQYKALNRSFDKMLAASDERRLSDSDIETLRQCHEEISMSVSKADDFLMFHNAGAFCCQLLISIILLYDLIFFHATNDLLIIVMHVVWMFGVLSGLTVTTAGGIMVNHYVSTNANSLLSMQYLCNVGCLFSGKL